MHPTLSFAGISLLAASAVQGRWIPGGSQHPKARAALWQPAAGIKWQIDILNPVLVSSTKTTPDVPVWDLDLEMNTIDISTDIFGELKGAGKKLICYFSAGTYEPDRKNSTDFQSADLGNTVDGWPQEKWVNVNSESVRNIMKWRMDLAAQKGCNAIDPDNVDGYSNNNGLGLTQTDAINYVKWLSQYAASKGMSMGLKNGAEILSKVIDNVAFAVVEQCTDNNECARYQPLIKAGKPVFRIEYPAKAPKPEQSTIDHYCSTTGASAGSEQMSTVLKDSELSGWVRYCGDSTSYTTQETEDDLDTGKGDGSDDDNDDDDN